MAVTVKTLVFIMVMMCWRLTSFSQTNAEIDFLVTTLDSSQNNPDASRINARLGWLLYNEKQYKTSLQHYYQALKLATGDSRAGWLGDVHFGIAANYHALDKWDSSKNHYETALSVFKEVNDSVNVAIVYGNLAILYKYRDLYEESLASALNALSVLEKGPPSFGLASCYNLIGSIYKTTKNYKEANIYYRKALSVRIKINQPLEVAKSYNNLGELFLLSHQYDSAKRNLLLSAKLKRQLHDTQGLARTQTRLGKALIHTGENIAAETQLLESLKTQRDIDDSVGLIETLNNLGELYLITNRLSESNEILKEANTIILTSGTPDYLRQNLELRVAHARKQKEFSSGMDLQDQLLAIRDSILNEEKSKSLQAMQIRFETQKKEQEIALLQQQEEINKAKIESNRILIGALVSSLMLVGTIGSLVYLNLKNAKAAKQRIELLLSETRHRMKNHLQTLASIFHLQTRHYTNQDMVLEAQSSETRVHTMSLLHDKFFTNEIDQVLNAREYISDLVHKLVDIYGSHTRNLKLSLEIDNVELDIDRAFALSLIIQELVCNSFKYAFDHQPDPELYVVIRLHSGFVNTSIQDNGIGFNTNKFGTSQGLNLVDALVSQLDGEMRIDHQYGTKFIIRFPATSLWKRPAFS